MLPILPEQTVIFFVSMVKPEVRTQEVDRRGLASTAWEPIPSRKGVRQTSKLQPRLGLPR
jgi:hypothetical protein